MTPKQKAECMRIAALKYELAGQFLNKSAEYARKAADEIAEANEINYRLNQLLKRPKLRLIDDEKKETELVQTEVMEANE